MRVSASSVISSAAETQRDAGEVRGGDGELMRGECTIRRARRSRWRSAAQPAFVAGVGGVGGAAAAGAVRSPSRPRASAAGAAFVLAVYGIGSLVCHQLPARSFHLWSAQMPVCARCAGIYFGAAVAARRDR